MSKLQLHTIISGAQTGADQAGLFAAEALGLKTSGYVTLNHRTETGLRPELSQRFKLIQLADDSYPPRTKQNVFVSDGTAIFGKITSPGSRRTLSLCKELHKSNYFLGWYKGIQYPHQLATAQQRQDQFLQWLINAKVQTLNIAGNRESINPGIYNFVFDFLVSALKDHINAR